MKKIVLSLGRLHPLKGLDLLVEAWAEVKRSSKVLKCESAKVGAESTEDGQAAENFRTLELSNFRTSSWQLVIAGPDEQGTLEKLKMESEKLKLKTAQAGDLAGAEDADVVFLDAVHGEEKWKLMKRADIFVLPSRSENFGMVVGEALSCGVPVVTTAVGPWGEGRGERSLARADGGEDELPLARAGLYVVETSAEGIAQGLLQMMALSDAERQKMGERGCAWVKQAFSWESVAKRMVEAYEEVR